MHELSASIANVLAGLNELAQTVNQINHGLRSAFRLDALPPAAPTQTAPVVPATPTQIGRAHV